MFTAREEAEIVRIALEAEIYGYENDFVRQIQIFTQGETKKLKQLLKWLRSKKNVRPLISLYLELALLASCFINPANAHELERV